MLFLVVFHMHHVYTHLNLYFPDSFEAIIHSSILQKYYLLHFVRYRELPPQVHFLLIFIHTSSICPEIAPQQFQFLQQYMNKGAWNPENGCSQINASLKMKKHFQSLNISQYIKSRASYL